MDSPGALWSDLREIFENQQSSLGFVTPPHRAAAGGAPEAEDDRGGPGRALGGEVSVYQIEGPSSESCFLGWVGLCRGWVR